MSPARRLRLQRQAMTSAFYAVDRLERDIAVLVSDSGATVQMPRVELPAGIREGAVLLVRFAQNLPDWSSAVIDTEEERRRLREAKEMLDDLKRSDPGGDIAL
jgi:hypothetical protein